MKTEQKHNMAMNVLVLLLIALFIISISMMWLKHDQYHRDGSTMSWMMSENSSVYPNSYHIEDYQIEDKQKIEDYKTRSGTIDTNMTR